MVVGVLSGPRSVLRLSGRADSPRWVLLGCWWGGSLGARQTIIVDAIFWSGVDGLILETRVG